MTGHDKFEWIDVHPEPCSRDELREHLEAFVDAFVPPNRRDRWRLILIEKPERAKSDLYLLPLDERYCRELRGNENFPQYIERFADNKRGVFFDPRRDEPVMLRPSEALVQAVADYTDAICSIEPGKLALFFHHDCGVWLCQR